MLSLAMDKENIYMYIQAFYYTAPSTKSDAVDTHFRTKTNKVISLITLHVRGNT